MADTQTPEQAQPTMPESAKAQLIAALQQNWRREREGALTDRELAGHEKDPNKRGVLLRLAEAEERHAQKWERKLADLGAAPQSGGFEPKR